MDASTDWVDGLETLEDCAFESERLLDAIADIKSQLGAAKARVFSDGEFSDPVWFSKATAALRYYQRDLQKVQNRRSLLRRHYNLAKAESNDRALVSLFKELFPEEFYAAVSKLNGGG